MIRMRLSNEDLAQTRFAFSPLWEVVTSSRALVDPARHALHLPWVRTAREALKGVDLRHLGALVRPEGYYVPDFLAPPPITPFPEFSEELERLRRTPSCVVREEVARMGWHPKPYVATAREYLSDPRGAVIRLAIALERYHQLVLAPHWPRLRTLLEADVLRRARALAFGGAEALYADLHPSVRYRDGSLEVGKSHEEELDRAGRGVLLVPAVFAWPDVYVITDAPWRPTLVYSPRGVGGLWSSEPAGAALEAALGTGRAAVLKVLVAPSTTGEVARVLGITPGAVSQHLARLRVAGLVESARSGKRVYHRPSSTGESLLSVFGEGHEA
jgi:DNA-binding transcriptional ArsR family regulator